MNKTALIPTCETCRTYTRVHVDKMGNPLFSELRGRGLATPSDDDQDWSWWRVETTTAAAVTAWAVPAR